MKLSEHTIEVLKNFASINQNLVIKEGSTLTTMSAMKNIVAKADVEENFESEFGKDKWMLKNKLTSIMYGPKYTFECGCGSFHKFYDMSVSKNVMFVAAPNKLIMSCENGYWTGVSIKGIFSLKVTSMWTCLATTALGFTQ